MYGCMHAYMHECAHACMCACMHLCLYLIVQTRVYPSCPLLDAYMRIYTDTFIHAHIHGYVHTYPLLGVYNGCEYTLYLIVQYISHMHTSTCAASALGAHILDAVCNFIHSRMCVCVWMCAHIV